VNEQRVQGGRRGRPSILHYTHSRSFRAFTRSPLPVTDTPTPMHASIHLCYHTALTPDGNSLCSSCSPSPLILDHYYHWAAQLFCPASYLISRHRCNQPPPRLCMCCGCTIRIRGHATSLNYTGTRSPFFLRWPTLPASFSTPAMASPLLLTYTRRLLSFGLLRSTSNTLQPSFKRAVYESGGSVQGPSVRRRRRKRTNEQDGETRTGDR